MSDDLFTQDIIEFMDSSELKIRELEGLVKKLEGRLQLLEELVFKLWPKEGRA